MAYAFLALAVVFEVAATLALRMAAGGPPRGRRRWYLVVAPGYVVAFSALTLALREGLALGVAYGIWTAAGVAATAVLSRVLFGEVLDRTMVLGIALIGAGVLLVELGAGG